MQEPLIDKPLLPEQALRRSFKPCTCFGVCFVLILTSSFSTLGQIAYGLSYYQDTKNISLECQESNNEWRQCTAEEACANNLSYVITLDKPHTFRNWIYDFDLLCPAVNHQLTYLTTVYFFAFLLSAIGSLWLADRIGRKPIILGGLAIHLLADIPLVLVLFKSETFLFIYMFMIGIRGPMASHTISLMLQEFGLPEIRSYYSMMVTVSDNSTSLFLSFYFYYIGDWRIVIWFNICLVTLGFILILIFVPESPRFLHNTRRFSRARRSYNFLARMTGKQTLTEKLSGEEIISQIAL